MITGTTPEAGHAAAPDEHEIDIAIRDAAEALDSEWPDEAILACERAFQHDPKCAEALLILGLVYFDLNEPSKAIETLEQAHQWNPARQEIAEALAAIMVRIGKVNEALFYAKLAITLEPHPHIENLLPERFGTFFKNFESGNPNLYFWRATGSFRDGLYEETIDNCRRQLELTPRDNPTLRLLGHASLMAGQFESAIVAFHGAFSSQPPDPHDLSRLGLALAALGRNAEAEVCLEEAVVLAPDDARLHSMIVSDLVRRPGTSAARIKSVQAAWIKRHAKDIRAREVAPRAGRDPDQPLRVGYVSNCFYHSDFSELFEPVLHAHRRGRVEAYCYHDSPRNDSSSESLMAGAAKWIEIAGVDDETLWEIFRGDEIDIAVDLCGHVDGGRPLAFARRLAPVSVSWLGYPLPLGLEGLDYFLSDAVASPGKAPDTWRLPRTPFAFLAHASIPDIGPSPAERSGHLTFGVSCDLRLLTPAVLHGWSHLLSAVDSAHLLICNRFNQDSAGIRRISELFAHFGLGARVDVVNMSENFSSEYEFYRHVDIALDTGSCDSLAENCRAIWMGVPLMTLAGPHPAARLGASLVHAAGHEDWAVRNPKGLAALAKRLGKDLGSLAALRAGLREAVLTSPLANPVDLTAALETAYHEMWERRLAES